VILAAAKTQIVVEHFLTSSLCNPVVDEVIDCLILQQAVTRRNGMVFWFAFPEADVFHVHSSLHESFILLADCTCR